MRIGLFGGTFDPPHRGHIAVAEAAMERLCLDRVLMAPVGLQPLKWNQIPSSFADRLRMVDLAVAGNLKLEASGVDAPRLDGRPNYTIDAIETLRHELDPEDELFCIMGADSFLTLKKWHRAAELLVACDFIVAARPGFALESMGQRGLAAVLPDGIVLEAAGGGPDCVALSAHSASGKSSTIYLLPDLSMDVSATEIRAALAAGADAEGPLDATVVRYIADHGLYR